MKKSFLILICLTLFGLSPAMADYIFVSGPVYGNWSADTVFVDSTIWIPPDSTLSIEPGVKVLFWVCCQFIVEPNATLLAVGLPDDSIHFDEYFENNHWKGIRFLSASDSCRLEYCHLTNGDAFGSGADERGGAIHLDNTSLTITNCLINDCSATFAGGIDFQDSSNATISKSTIAGNSASSNGGGIICGGLSNPTIDSCLIVGNSADGYGGGIRLNGTNPIISNSIIILNSAQKGGGIYCGEDSRPEIICDSISGNWASGGSYPTGGAIHCENSSPDIIGNIISGNSAYNGGGIACYNNSSPYIYGNDIRENSSNGTWSGGGGIQCDHNDQYSYPIIINNTFNLNSANWGGAINCGYSENPYISNNTIIENSAQYGGGISLGWGGSNICIISNVIDNNSASVLGGGMFVTSQIQTVRSNIISDNTSSSIGGGIYFSAGTDTFELNEISGNSASGNGGGIYLTGTSPTISKCTIVSDSAGGSGGGLYACNYSSPHLINCILWDSFPEQIDLTLNSNVQATYSDINQIWSGIGVINADPLFENPSNGNYQITWANYPDPDSTQSPCIDTGDPNSEPDPDRTIADMGAYYFHQITPGIAVSPNSLDFGSIIYGTQDSLTLTVYSVGDTNLILYDVFTFDSVYYTDFDPNDSLLIPGDSLVLWVTFAPQAALTYFDTLTILTNAPHLQDTVSISLNGAGASPVIIITLTPTNPPIIIPASGGSFDYTLDIVNQETTPITFDAWIDVTLPDSTIYGPIISRTLTLAGGGSLVRSLSQNVPGGAPAGEYSYNGYVGEIPVSVWDSSSFNFTKSGADGSGMIGGWELYGWDGDEAPTIQTPSEFALHPAYPNPFNPETNLTFDLPQAGEVSLIIYDIQGREVVRLVDGYHSAGFYKLSWNTGDNPSGVCFARLKTNEFSQTRKLLLVK